MMANEDHITCIVPAHAEMRFPIAGGKSLVFGRGDALCRVAFHKAPTSRYDWDEVIGTLMVADRSGRLYRVQRTLFANVFLELLRVSEPTRPGVQLREFVSDARCYLDHRTPIPAVVLDKKAEYAFAYRTRGLEVTLDILARDMVGRDRLVIRVHPQRGAGLSGEESPMVLAENDWAARIVLTPRVFETHVPAGYSTESFEATDATSEPQPMVWAE